MTLVSMKAELSRAGREGYAVPLFDVFEVLGVEGLMEALTARRAPTIMGIYGPYATRENCPAFASYIRRRAQDTEVPISLMLDHGERVEQCLEALEAGFTDIMYDGSRLAFEDNVANTRVVVAAAHAVGAGVEAELGHVGEGSQYQEAGASAFTDPSLVERFVEETGVDFLAISFGNAHGTYASAPSIDLELIAEIHGRVSVPLVMHGGSGVSDAQFKAAINAGISKVNYATDIMCSAAANMEALARQPGSGMMDICQGVHSAYCDHAKRLYEVFSTARD